MSRPSRLVSVWLASAIAVAAPSARAWVERTVRSDSVTVDVARDATAVVTHEILLGVRGGPLPEISVEPVDADAELLQGATETRAESGHAAGLPLPLSATKVGSKVVLRVVGQKGMRSGTFQIRFSYRTSLEGKLQPGRSSTTVEWTGPSFADGIDSARVVFRVPRGPSPPRLASAHPGADAVSLTDDTDGVFLGTFRRGVDKDELEVVRPHMAKGEAVPWRITVDASTFDVSTTNVATSTPTADAPAPPRSAAPRPVRNRHALWGGMLALCAALLAVVVWKSFWVEEACRRRGARARPLLPVRSWFRGLLSALSVGFAAYAVVELLEPLLAALALLVAMIAATHLPPRLSAALRGPGKWTRLDAEVAFDAKSPVSRLPGRFVDAGTVPGFLLFASLLASLVAFAVVLSQKSSYQAMCVALGSAILFPIFCTGRSGELPESAALAPRDLLEWLMGELEGSTSVEVAPLGRLPQGATSHDELRLLVVPKPALQGFVALEVGLDHHQGLLGLLPLPYVIVRAVENSPAAESLPKGLLWTRGRDADERVAVLRPKVPTQKVTLDLVRALLRRLTSAPRQRVAIKPSRSAGKGQSTAKAGTVSSPAQAT